MNGHDHGDDMGTINQIPYFTVNSASYIWHGMKASHVYPEDMYIKFPGLQDLILYKTALYCIVEIEDENVKIHGANSEYMGITPENIGIANRRWNGISIEPKISNWGSKIH